MTEPGTSEGIRPAASDPPEDVDTLSKEIEALADRADRLASEWDRRFGRDCFLNPVFVHAYSAAIRGHSILGVFKTLLARETGDPGPAARPFEERFEATADAAGTSAPVLDPVPVSLFHYLDYLLVEARREKEEGLLVDPEPLRRVITFGSQLKDLPALSGFRRDLLEQFPSRTDPSGSEQAKEPQDAAAGSPRMPKPKELPKGYLLGKVEVVRLLGTGGFAQVYQVFHPGLHEHRAAKLFTKLNLLGELDQLLKAFYAEAQLQNKLKHPNIVRVLDVDEHEGYLVLLMEYVEGRNLRSLIEERKKAKAHLRPVEILKIVIQAAKGLEYAHTQKILHRDIKPENIMIALDGSVKISDFGLAKTLNESGQRRTTRQGNLIGTPHYMAPEQVFGDVYDHRVDLYALGAVLYHMAYGEPPFDAKDAWKVLEKQRNEKPVPLRDYLEDFPPELDRIVLRLLEKNPDHRYASATELIRDLEACLSSLEAPDSPGSRGKPRRGRLVATLAAALLALGPGYFGLQMWKETQKDRDGASVQAKDQGAAGRAEISPAAPTDDKVDRKAAPTEVHEAPAPLSRENGVLKTPEPPAKVPEPKPAALPLRQQLAQYPLAAEDALFMTQILDACSKHRAELLHRVYEPVAKELNALSSGAKGEYQAAQGQAAQDLVRLAGDLVRDRWKELSESKEEIRLKLGDGKTAQGVVDHADEGALTLADGRGGKTGIDIATIAPEEFLRGRTIALAEVAYQALSGDAGKALAQAKELATQKEKVALWYPALVRLARLEAGEHIRATLAQAEVPLSRKESRQAFEKLLVRYPQALATLRALSASEANICSLYPFLEREFQEARREGEALELLLDGAFSKVLSKTPGTEAESVAGTLLLAGFLSELEPAHDDLMAKKGWLNYNWELRPDEASIKDRIQYWDLLDEGGSVLRDPQGPRSLIMGRPHPRVSEGILIRFEFEPLGEGRASAEWRFNLRREGGGNTYLRLDEESLSLRTFTLGSASPDETLVTVKIPRDQAEPKTHTCVLVPGEQLHVFLDGALVASLKKEDTILPSQPSLVVQQGKLSMRSIQVLKKPTK